MSTDSKSVCEVCDEPLCTACGQCRTCKECDCDEEMCEYCHGSGKLAIFGSNPPQYVHCAWCNGEGWVQSAN